MVFVLLPIAISMMSTAAIDAFSNKSAPPVAASTTTLNRHNAQNEAQQQQQPSQAHSLSSRSLGLQSGSERPTRRKSALSFSPADIGGAATLLSMKLDGAKAIANPTQVLTDASYVVMDPNKFFPDIKISKLRMQYAQVFGRLMVLGTTFLPHHGVHPEELAVQLFLLSVSMKPSSVRFSCINVSTSAKGNCAEECALEFEELEAALNIAPTAIQPGIAV
eukprot:CAMPEP_0170992428 /NCGR_PEP_ID=MMETSP0736-20130129/9742_1 /TAXON_ID=186038 /ORGANISM="Fragilariopsis kerguelensis, Strain L26-C5" /LENGTH=219 /DNA_ID=CAMNT_0011417893 /DNA_START=65 /DNA_END=725 /DNA_ORIENTATION=-